MDEYIIIIKCQKKGKGKIIYCLKYIREYKQNILKSIHK